MSVQQYKRKVTLVVSKAATSGNNISAYVPPQTLDLSQFHFTFKTAQQDVESPGNCSIRVYNLAETTVQSMFKTEYSQVVLQAGYEGSFGIIFSGTIKQYRVGRENATTTYLDILAADGDEAYNFATIAQTVAAGTTRNDRIKTAVKQMGSHGTNLGYLLADTGGVLPRGKVLFGMARDCIRNECLNGGAGWSISNGKVNVVPIDRYLPGDVVTLNSFTGMIGLPEQTENGITVKCLLNPKITVGGLVQIDNKSVNQIVSADPKSAPIAFNSYTGLQLLATVTNDGFYRVYVAEHEGDTRGQAWWTSITCLAIDTANKKVQVR